MRCAHGLERLARTLVLVSLGVAAMSARAQSWDASLDLRLVDSSATESYLNGGFGTLRYGEHQSGLQLGRARLAFALPIGQVLELRVDASSWGSPERNPVDLTEAYLEFRPYPVDGFRARIKAGAFFPPTTLENTAGGWESAYSLSSSALDTWVGEELRTIGAQAQVDWLGTRLGHDLDVGLVGAVFGWNDPAGVALATHGFTIDDRQTTLFGSVADSGSDNARGFALFHEIDGHAGRYGGLDVRYLDRISVIVLRYDNHTDPSAFDPVLGEHSWLTRFTTAGVKAQTANGWTAIAQWLQGTTYVAPAGFDELGWDFDTHYFLLSRQLGRQFLTVRYDVFDVEPEAPVTRGDQNGHAVTLAYGFEPTPHWRLLLEWVRVRSSQSDRFIELGADPYATDRALQLSVRYSIGSD